ncbi:hypothetical protein [Rubrivirga marina]|uniref:Tetratricopeptide repeat protein n=1 Tax=Rubrivirga marina TaxID=1196024 RepID=A0A271J0E2_9BACT|nr:hypothetical protein [Rubrivirga marina]PAP76708.1 hypothetical protein BSZ37_09780 [Rubrivirga marina]
MRAFLLALMMAASAAAQPGTTPADLLVAMEAAVARFDYETAEDRAREALSRFDALSPDQLVTVHSTLGILLHAKDEPVEARRQFEAALSIDPTLSLDPVLVSPKTVEFFDEVRATTSTDGASAAPPELRYVLIEDRRTAGALRSMILPGWGQFYKGDRAKGFVFALAGGAATVVADLRRAEARDAYLEATGEEVIAQLYEEYDQRYRLSSALVRGAAVVWGASMLDALLTGGPEPVRRVSVTTAEEGTGLRLRASF